MQYQALASDYDGTLAHDGHVSRITVAAVQRLKDSGRKFILVTGRELPELLSVFPDVGICDAVVAENGALLYWPADRKEETLAEPPPPAFISEMATRGVQPFSVGRVIFATWRPHETAVLEVIQQLGLESHIIFNKRAVMVLPSGVNKATGLAKVLRRLKISPSHVVGVGDAENDHAFLDSCAVAAAVENALPSLKEKCDLVLAADHGRGVIELIDQILADDLQRFGPRRPRKELAGHVVPKDDTAQDPARDNGAKGKPAQPMPPSGPNGADAHSTAAKRA
jgi:hydroxymethylpyrimidine pyrophosphatase-like HAD family hydrolase